MRILFLLLIFISGEVLGQNAYKRLTILPLTKDFFIYTTYGDPGNGKMVTANGMYMVTGKGVVLFDTPWDSTQFQPLLDSIQSRHHQKVIVCLSTHFHEDRTLGLNYYKSKGIRTFTSRMTDSLSKKHHNPRAEYFITRDTIFKIGSHSFETYYPGEGHSPDNMVIWFKKERILYGGCFIKSVEAKNLGNLNDDDAKEWVISIKKVQKRCPDPIYVIPGHQSWTHKNSLTHTLKLLENSNN